MGSYLMPLLKADNCDIVDDWNFLDGVAREYKTIVFLACDQENSQRAFQYNLKLYKALDAYRLQYPKTYLIYISSAAIYYKASVYGLTKILGEVYASRFQKRTILRPSNIYGHGDGHGAPDKFLNGETVIFGDGNQIRDLIPVEKVADIIAGFVNRPETGIFNVSSGVGTTINQMFEMFGSGEPKHVKDIKRNMGVKESILMPGRVDD